MSKRGISSHQRGRGRGRGYWRGSRGFRNPTSAVIGENILTNLNSHRKRFSSDVGQRLSEVDVGITEYISKGKGFLGIIKERYSDFHVNEINIDGDIVKLTCDIPTKPNKADDDSKRTFSCHELIPIEKWEQLKALSESMEGKVINENEEVVKTHSTLPKEGETTGDILPLSSISESAVSEKKLETVEIEVNDISKDSRRAIHTHIKEAFKNLNSNTLDRDGKKYIVIKRGKDVRREYGNNKYLHFILHKRNMDTAETVIAISRKLGLNPSKITYAGTKDKRGITSQLLCIRGGNPQRLFRVSKELVNVTLGNYSYKSEGLRLGDLKGNQFRIAIRKVTGSDEDIQKAMSSLKEFGFINYFGLQRFGSNYSVPTHEIGKMLLQGKFEKAVDAILQPQKDGSTRVCGEDVSSACKEWHSSRDSNEALLKLNSGLNSIEGALLSGLSKCEQNDYVGALSSLPRNTRSLYLHSYQSLLWNKIVSRRIKEYGLQPIIGDLILVTDNGDHILDHITSDLIEERDKDSPLMKQQVRCITEDDLSNISINDIVLPMPGYDIVYPNNVIREWYTELLKEDGLSSDSFQSKVQQYSLRGTYRHIVSHPTNLSWSIVNYKNPETDLILSDLDEMLKKTLSYEQEGGEYKALLLTMKLNTSSYATMALREVLKIDTSASTHARMSSQAAAALNKDCRDHQEEGQNTTDTLKPDAKLNDLSEATKVEGTSVVEIILDAEKDTSPLDQTASCMTSMEDSSSCHNDTSDATKVEQTSVVEIKLDAESDTSHTVQKASCVTLMEDISSCSKRTAECSNEDSPQEKKRKSE